MSLHLNDSYNLLIRNDIFLRIKLLMEELTFHYFYLKFRLIASLYDCSVSNYC